MEELGVHGVAKSRTRLSNFTSCEDSRTVQMKYGLTLWSCYTKCWLPTLVSLSNCCFGFYVCVCVCTLSRVWVFVTPWTVACQAPLSMEFRRREYCRHSFPIPGDLPGIEPDIVCLNSLCFRFLMPHNLILILWPTIQTSLLHTSTALSFGLSH